MAKVVIEGLPEFRAAVGELKTRIDAASRVIVVQSAALIEARAKRNFSGSHRRGEPHTGGAQPNVVTGFLRRSITTDPVTRSGFGVWSTQVGPTAVYGRRIELGHGGGGKGRGRQRTRPFPYLGPAVDVTALQRQYVAVEQWAKAFS